MLDHLFLSVGAMKAGTTWLHQQLVGHPDIHFCPEKEIHYFADPFGQTYMSMAGRVGRFQQVARNLKPARVNAHVQKNLSWYASTYLAPEVDDSWYASLFDARSPAKVNARYVADFSNLYATLGQSGWDHIRSVAGTVRALYTMRHPAKRLWSHLKFSYEFSGRSAQLASLNDDNITSFLRDPNNLAHADYASAVERLRTVLDPHEVGFFFFEDFRERSVESLRSIEQFLEIGARNYPAEKLTARVNPSQEMSVPALFAQAADRLRKEQIDRLSMLGLTVPESWHTPLH